MQALLAVVAREMHVPEDEVVDIVLGGIIALLAMCLVQMSRSNDTHTSRRDGDDK